VSVSIRRVNLPRAERGAKVPPQLDQPFRVVAVVVRDEHVAHAPHASALHGREQPREVVWPALAGINQDPALSAADEVRVGTLQRIQAWVAAEDAQHQRTQRRDVGERLECRQTASPSLAAAEHAPSEGVHGADAGGGDDGAGEGHVRTGWAAKVGSTWQRPPTR